MSRARPGSIIWFEWLNLLSVLLIFPQNYLDWEGIKAAAAADNVDPITTLVLVQGATVAIILFLVLMISRARSRVFKWIYVVLCGAGLVGMLFLLPTQFAESPSAAAVAVVQNLVSLCAIVMLFRPDTIRWLAGQDEVDPEIFR